MTSSVSRAQIATEPGKTGPGKPVLHAVPPPAAERSQIRVAVVTSDPFVRAGVAGELRSKPGIQLLDDPAAGAHVVVAVLDTARRLHEVLPAAGPAARLVLVADGPRPAELLTAVEHGLAVLLTRSEANTPRLLQAVADAAHGRGELPADELGQLLRGISRLHHEVLAPRELTLNGLARRESEVLRLLAEGLDTAEIATDMAYSERTVKNILHGLLQRLGLRNRTHAVAHALREGLI